MNRDAINNYASALLFVACFIALLVFHPDLTRHHLASIYATINLAINMPLGERYLIMNSRDFRGIGEKGHLKNEMEKTAALLATSTSIRQCAINAKMPAGSGTNMKRHSFTF